MERNISSSWRIFDLKMTTRQIEVLLILATWDTWFFTTHFQVTKKHTQVKQGIHLVQNKFWGQRIHIKSTTSTLLRTSAKTPGRCTYHWDLQRYTGWEWCKSLKTSPENAVNLDGLLGHFFDRKSMQKIWILGGGWLFFYLFDWTSQLRVNIFPKSAVNIQKKHWNHLPYLNYSFLHRLTWSEHHIELKTEQNLALKAPHREVQI